MLVYVRNNIVFDLVFKVWWLENNVEEEDFV